MRQRDFQFIDQTGAAAEPVKLIPAMVIPKEAIEAEIERLASLPAPPNGRRASAIVNAAAGVGNGLAPGTAVSLSVLKPGEQTAAPPPLLGGGLRLGLGLGGRGRRRSLRGGAGRGLLLAGLLGHSGSIVNPVIQRTGGKSSSSTGKSLDTAITSR